MFLLEIVILVVVIGISILLVQGTRRIPVQYGRSVFTGGRMQRQSGSSFLPIRVNSAGMIPLIFAFSIVILPATIASYFVSPLSDDIFSKFASIVANGLNPSNFVYWAIVFVLVIIFTFFYTLVTFQQQNLAENLQKNGGFIPGIRPGRPTQRYLAGVVNRITVAGAVFLGFIAVVPFLAQTVTGAQAVAISATGLLIVVGVVLDTMRQLESQLMMRNYEGFIR